VLSELVMKDKEEKTKDRWITRSNYASRLGEECVRKLCYHRTHYDMQEKIDTRGMARMDLGKLLEQYSRDQINGVLRQYGIEIERQEYPAKWEEFEISGKTDGIIYLAQAEIDAGQIIPETKNKDRTIPVILEIKSVRDTVFDLIHTLDDLMNYWWMKKYLAQIQLYLISTGYENGIIFMVSTDGRFKDFMVKMDLEVAEACVKKAEIVQEYLQAYAAAGKPHDDMEKLEGLLPERINHDMETCKRCDFRQVCAPPMEFGDELQVIDNDELEKRLNERAENKQQRDIYEKAHKKARKALGGRENVLVGRWHCKGKKDKRGSVTYEFIDLETEDAIKAVLKGEKK